VLGLTILNLYAILPKYWAVFLPQIIEEKTMLVGVIKQFNWVDVLVIIIMIRICYVAVKSGLAVEIFKALGTICAIYLSLHYYTALSDFCKDRIAPGNVMPLEFLDFIFFVLLVIAGYLAFVVLRQVFSRFIKTDAVPQLMVLGGLILGICRAFLLASLIAFMLVISTISYFKASVEKSYLGGTVFKIAPKVYAGLWNGVFSKFMTQEKINRTVFDVQAPDSAKE